MTKKIGILTSGGDCSGLNSVIRAAFLRSKILGYELIGIRRGLKGLVERPMNCFKIESDICKESLLSQSGSILLSNTKFPLAANQKKYSNEECEKFAADGYKNLGLSGLIYVGGDGSLSIMHNILSNNSELNIVAIPKTIDNDVSATDLSIGFATAVEVVTESIENIRSTAISHERIMVVEVMGRDAGFIAMHAGIATGADVILVPEFKCNTEKLIEHVRGCYESGKNHCIIIVAEAVETEDLTHTVIKLDEENKFSRTIYQGIGEHIASMLKGYGFDSRSVTLGHIQRGGKTSVLDRIVASGFGVEAVDVIDSGKCGVMLSYVNNMIKTTPIEDVAKSINRKLSEDDICVHIAQKLGVYIGEI